MKGICQELDGSEDNCEAQCAGQGDLKYMSQESGSSNSFLLLQGKEKAGDTDRCGADEAQLDRDKGIGSAQNDKDQTEEDGIDRFCQVEGADALDIGDDRPTFLYNILHTGKVRVKQDDMGALPGGVCPFCHGDPAVGVFQSQHIIYPVAYHADDISLCLIGFQDPLLHLRRYSAKDSVP